MVNPSRPRSLDDFGEELDSLSKSGNEIVHSLTTTRPEHALRARQAEWHIRGMVYHCKNIHRFYCSFAKEVSSRVNAGASTIIMYSPEFQSLLFEFYALVNITKIALDNLRDYLAPLFKTPYNQLPKSVSDFVDGNTDCPVYIFLSQQPILPYLIDLRNCLVHYRSFATSDNAIVFEEGFEDPDFIGDEAFFKAMARASFRRVEESVNAVNIYVPDNIFERDSRGNKRLAKFTYEERWNLLSMSSSFCQLGSLTLLKSLRLLLQNETTKYSYKRRNLLK
jgi:hypothetical protein